MEAAIRPVLEEYGLRALSDPVAASSGFSGANVWRVETGRGTFALRATPQDVVEIERLQGLHRLLAWIAQRGIPEVAVPRATHRGFTFQVRDGHVWQLEPWMPGEATFRQSPSRARLIAAMHGLGRLHRAAAEFEPLLPERRWFFRELTDSPGLGERLRHLKRWDGTLRHAVRTKLLGLGWPEFRSLGIRTLDLFERHAPRVGTLLLSVRELEIPAQPCLRDVWHDHLLFTGDQLTGLIDAHACRSDCVATDLARLLGSLLGDNRVEWDFALQVYQEVRPLSVDERALVEIFDQSAVLLNGLTWLDWICFRGRQFPDPERVVSRMREIVTRMEHLA